MVQFKNLSKKKVEDNNDLTQKKSKVSFSSLDRNPLADPVVIESKNGHSNESSKTLYGEASEYLNQVFNAVKSEQSFSLESGFSIMRKMVEVQPFQDVLFIMAIHMENQYRIEINHSVNLAIFAIKMGASLGFTKEQQTEIGMTALLHDIGMALIPDSIINKQDKLTPHELKIFKERPRNSYTILNPFKGSYPYLVECALQVHERIDGSGYPQGLKDDEIHEYSQIIGLLDMYEALIHSRPQREKMLHFKAVKMIIKTSKNSFQRKHLKVLLSIFSIFPIHSYVRLNSKAIGKVIKTYPDQPMRPRLKIVYDSQNRKVLTDRIVNLPENPLLYILDSVSEEELMEG